jgi:DNA/RNA endonuclease G (NUC1)
MYKSKSSLAAVFHLLWMRLLPVSFTAVVGLSLLFSPGCGGKGPGEVATPSISTQPVDQTALDGSVATFSLSATGEGITYQWSRNGIPIPGAVSASYTTPTLAYAPDNNALYKAVVTNSAGTAASNQAKLTVTPKPTSISILSDQTVVDGTAASFSVTVSGTGPFAYQWKRNGTAISGATAATWNTAPVAFATDNNSTFQVEVTNGAGQATVSATAKLTVTPKVTLLSGFGDQTALDGSSATFSVSANGSGPFAYQWKRNGVSLAVPSLPSLTVSPVAYVPDNNAKFVVVVTNGAGQETASQDAILRVTPKPTVITGPSDQTAQDGSTATFSVAATGTLPMSYQWKRGGIDIPGATSASFTTPNLEYATDNLALISVVVTNGAGQPTTSGNAKLTVTPKTTVLTGLTDQTVLDGTTATFTINATGTGPFTYEWIRNGGLILDALSPSLSIPQVAYAQDHKAWFAVVVTNGTGQKTTAGPVTLKVTPRATVLAGPAAQTALDGATATFSVSASGTGPFTYQWMRGGTNIPGARAMSYTTGTLVWASDNGASFSVVVTNGASQATPSAAASLTVTPITLAFTTQPTGGSFVMGTTANLTCTLSGTGPVTYQWRKGGIDLPGKTSQDLALADLHGEDAGTYSVVATGPAGSVTSEDAAITVTSNLTIQTQPGAQTVTAPDGATFSVVAGGTGPFTYQWKKNGTDVPAATGSSYTTGSTDLKMVPDSYSVVVSDGIGSIESSSVSFTVVAPHPFYLPAGMPVPVPSRPLTVLPSLNVDPVHFPNGSFMFGYDETLKNPAWTAYADFKVNSTFLNSGGDYQTDTRLDAPQVSKASMGTHGGAGFYLSNGQGFDRGHMAMRSDVAYRYGQQAGDDATYMSNLVPQVSYFNQRLWNDLEEAVGGKLSGGVFDNGLTAIFGRVWVYTGPVFTGTTDYWIPSTEVYTKTPGTLSAGTLAIAIPTACYKIMVTEPAAGQSLPRVVAWMSSNRSYTSAESADIWKYTTSLQRVEELTGIDFLPGLPHDASLTALKANVDVRGWGAKFEKATGPNVHILKPSWDLIPIATNPILKGDTVRMGDPVNFEATVTPNSAGGTVDTSSGCSWTFGDATGTTTGLTATHTYSTAGSFIATFSATDNLAQTNTITRVITVVDPSNTPPVVSPSTLSNVTVRVGNAVPPVTFTVSDDATAAGSLVVTAMSDDQTLVQDANLVATNTAGSVSLAITPEAAQIGSATITVTVTDGVGASTSKTFSFTVASNSSPVFTPSSIPDASTTVATAKNVTFSVADDATASGSITVTATSGNTTLLPDANISVSNVAGAITLTLTPAAGQTGTALITVTATDGEAASTVKTFTLTVAAPSHDLLETFEGGTKTAYAAADVNFTTGTWTLSDALVGNSASDRFNGTKCVRFKTFTGVLTMKFDSPYGAQTVTIQHAKFGSDAAGAWGLWYSTDSGTSWTQAGSNVTSTTTTLTPAVFTVNINSPIRFEIRHGDPSGTKRVCLDDFQIVGY